LYNRLKGHDLESLEDFAAWLREALEESRSANVPWGNQTPNPAEVFHEVAARGSVQAITHCAQMYVEIGQVADALRWIQRLGASEMESREVVARLFVPEGSSDSLTEPIFRRARSAELRRSNNLQQSENQRIEGPASKLDYEELSYDIDYANWESFRSTSRLTNLEYDLKKLRRQIELGETGSLERVAELYLAAGEHDGALRYYLRAAGCGSGGYNRAIRLLLEWGKSDDSERLRCYGIQSPNQVAEPWGPEDIGIDRSVADGAHLKLSTSARLLLQRWREGESRLGSAVVTAAVDLKMCGYDDPLPVELIVAAVRRRQAVGPSDQWLPGALTWAQAPVRDGAAFLIQDDHRESCFRLSETLLDLLPTCIDAKDVPESVWELVLDRAPDDLYWSICAAAASVGRLDLAVRVARRAAVRGEPDDLYNLGEILRLVGSESESLELFRRSADAGQPYALSRLAGHLAEQGNVTGAIENYSEAMQLGNVEAIVRLALLYLNMGENGKAETLFWRAVDHEHPLAMFNLAVLHSRRGEMIEAEALFRSAMAAGYPLAMTGLAKHLHVQGQEEEAEMLYRKAVRRKDGSASRHLGVLLESRDKFGEALHFYRMAVDWGYSEALYDLGNLLENLERPDAAAEAFRRGVTHGDVHSMNRLGLILHERGEDSHAEGLFRASISGGGTAALNNLALLISARGEQEEAIRLYREAITHGDAGAMNNLALVLAGMGEKDEADRLFCDAIEAGDSKAAENLARLRGEHESGRDT
jgi:tetratricopeptide (TPR) repeat protein